MSASAPATNRVRVRRGIILALAGLLVLSALLLVMPPPEKFLESTASRGHPPDEGWYAARGPAVARYNEQTDTTDALFRCSHQFCDVAVRLAGDQREELSRPHVLLRASDGPIAHAPLPEPLAWPYPAAGPGHSGETTTYLTGEWRAYSPWLGAVPYAIAATLLSVGFVLIFAKVPASASAGAVVAAALALVASQEVGWMAIYLFLMMGLPLLALVAGIGFLISRRHAAWRALPWACLVGGILFLPLTLMLNAYFPMPPTL